MTNLRFLLTSALALVLAAGCKTTDLSTFQVVCRFDTSFHSRTLVVTNADNQVLGHFEVPPGSTEMSESLESAPDALLDYHLIDTMFWSAGPQITTWRAIPNGARVFLTRSLHPQQFPSSKMLLLKVVGTNDSVSFELPCSRGNILGPNDSCNGYGPGPTTNTYRVSVFAGEDLCVQFQKTSTEEQRIGIFPTSFLQDGDTLVVNWLDLAHETYFEIECPSDLPSFGNASVKVLNLAKTRGTLLPSLFASGSVPNHLRVTVPAGFPLQDYYVQVGGSWATDQSLMQRVALAQTFAPGSPLKLEMPSDLPFPTLIHQPAQIYLMPSGDFDLQEIRLNYYYSDLDQGQFTDWVICSSPGCIPLYSLPDLSSFWPTKRPLPAQPKSYECSLRRFGQHTPAEVRAGFPFRSTAAGVAWPVAASGLQQVAFKQQ